jgi:pimeloyl-ACP methyl ester carboxylesterase
MKCDLPRTLACFRYLRLAGRLGLVAAAAVFAALPLRAEEVTIERDGLTLNADLHLADGKTVAEGVVLMTHAFLQHNRMEIMRVIPELFREHGYSTLAMTYSAGLDNRRGPYDCATPHRHSIEGHLDEIQLWLDWLKRNGASEVVLAGHSGGANRMSQFISERDDPAVSKVVLFAPGTSDHFGRTPEGYRARYRRDLSVILDKAQGLVDSGDGDAMMEDTDFAFCARATVSARTFLSYYGVTNTKARQFPRQMQRLKKPSLVVAAGEDNIAPDLTRLVEPYVDGKRLSLTVIEGCGHFFRDLCADDAVEAAVEFLEK